MEGVDHTRFRTKPLQALQQLKNKEVSVFALKNSDHTVIKS